MKSIYSNVDEMGTRQEIISAKNELFMSRQDTQLRKAEAEHYIQIKPFAL